MNFIIEHTGLWLDIWVYLGVILLAFTTVYFVVRRRKLIKMEEELTEMLEDKYAKENPEAEMDSEIEQ